jgi:hypothetical protein
MVTPSWTPSNSTQVTDCLQGKKRNVKNKVHTWKIASNVGKLATSLLPPFRIKGPTRISRLLIWLTKYKLYNTKIIPSETRKSKVSNDIFFIIYTLYYVVQINNLELRVGPLNRNGGSNMISKSATKYRKIQLEGTTVESITLDDNTYKNISTKIPQASNSSCKCLSG